ncbi:hypothetical protein A2U01_0116296, partial [Trifolium medium]|nr:hypothetical protein [Trifolium medium]
MRSQCNNCLWRIGNLHSEDPVLQLIGEQMEVRSNDDGEDILMVPAT